MYLASHCLPVFSWVPEMSMCVWNPAESTRNGQGRRLEDSDQANKVSDRCEGWETHVSKLSWRQAFM